MDWKNILKEVASTPKGDGVKFCAKCGIDMEVKEDVWVGGTYRKLIPKGRILGYDSSEFPGKKVCKDCKIREEYKKRGYGEGEGVPPDYKDIVL